MIIKKHMAGHRIILAICDDDLIGKRFEEDGLQLDLTSSFYKGEKMDEEAAGKMIEKAYILNIVGEQSIEFCRKLGFVGKENIIRIKKVPHAQVVLERE